MENEDEYGGPTEIGCQLWVDFKQAFREELEQTLGDPIEHLGRVINDDKCWEIVKAFRKWLEVE